MNVYDSYLEFPLLNVVRVARSAVYRFITLICSLLDTKVRLNWRRFDEYFSVLRELVGSIQLTKHFVIENMMISKLIRFIQN